MQSQFHCGQPSILNSNNLLDWLDRKPAMCPPSLSLDQSAHNRLRKLFPARFESLALASWRHPAFLMMRV